MNITAGKFKGRKVTAPDEKITRPTLSKTRESVFNILYSHIDFEGKAFLDVFAGSGIMGLEALSRGFETVCSFEKNFSTAKILKFNYAQLSLNPNLKVCDALKGLKELTAKFDVIYIDPPYESNLYEKCLTIIKANSLLASNGIIILEHSSPIEFDGFEILKQKVYSQKFLTFLIE
ncbi:16S rRNA (guanine(966)-N(2))-methyltransferase RsmD [bacterium]|nr:16S rRNA (guanine(966)-N(2))-methyltransferase RsmD [bacterium]